MQRHRNPISEPEDIPHIDLRGQQSYETERGYYPSSRPPPIQDIVPSMRQNHESNRGHGMEVRIVEQNGPYNGRMSSVYAYGGQNQQMEVHMVEDSGPDNGLLSAFSSMFGGRRERSSVYFRSS
jgi:hypothetical protein